MSSPLAYLLLKVLKSFGFPTFQLLAYMMKVIPERVVRTKLDIYVFITLNNVGVLFPFMNNLNQDINIVIKHFL